MQYSRLNTENRLPIWIALHKNAVKTFCKHICTFGIQQALSCLFPILVFIMLGLSHFFVGFLPRYDFMLITCLIIQIILYRIKIETRDELIVICIFHLLGLMMELFKVHYGSWQYPETAHCKILGVPLYSGFMYASVASYMCQAWRRFDLQITGWPNNITARIAGILIYINFFSNHFMPDLRYLIGVLVVCLFRKSMVLFRIADKTYRIPLILSFMFIGFFIWLAENIATRLGAWQYIYQHHRWTMVNYQKLSSWALLVIVSFIIIAELKMVKRSDKL